MSSSGPALVPSTAQPATGLPRRTGTAWVCALGCIRRDSRRRLATALCLFAAVAVLGHLNRRYLYNVLFGPFPLEHAALSPSTGPDDRWEYFVTVRGPGLHTLCTYSYTGGQRPYSVYALLPILDRRLLLRLPTDHEGEEFTGTLEDLSAVEEQFILAPLANRGREVILPFRLNANRYFRVGGYFTAVLPLAVLAGLALWQLISAFLPIRQAPAPRSRLPGRAGINV